LKHVSCGCRCKVSWSNIFSLVEKFCYKIQKATPEAVRISNDWVAINIDVSIPACFIPQTMQYKTWVIINH